MKRLKLNHVFEPRIDGDHHVGSSQRSRRLNSIGISFGSVIASLGMIILSGSAHGQAVNLGTADNFAIITFTGVTNTGYSNVYGDIALYGTPTITGFINAIPSSGVGYVHGTVYYDDGVAGTAWTDADAAYTDLQGRGGATSLTGQDLGALGMPLTAGVYNFTSSAQLTGNLVLDTGSDANAQFIFQISSTLTTAVGSSITVIGAGAGNTQNIFWQVGSSATLNTGSQFVGNIFARTSISMQEGSNVSLGRLFALDGALTMLTNSTSPEGIVLAGPGSYWNGRESNIWTGENWSDTVAGDTPEGNLAINADVIFSINDNPQEQNTVLGADISISSLTVNDVIPVTIGGPNTLTITGTGGFTGITINSGAGLTTIASNLELGVLAQTITVNNADGLVISGVMTGANGLIKQGTEELTLTGANTYTGATAINVGSLQVNSNNALGTNAAGTTVADGATLALNNVAYSTTEALEINGAGVLGGGALTNTGTSSYAGQITAATNATINAGGGVLTLTGGLVKNGTTLTLTGGGTININTVGISGALADSDLIVDSVTVNLNVANTYNGPTFIRSTAGAGLGILNANVVGALPTPRTELTMDDSGMGGSQLNLGAAQSVASLTGAASSLINLNANTLTVGTTAGSTTFAGVISGTGGLTKDDDSTQILTGSNTYTGATNVMDGTLQLGDGVATGSSIALISVITVDALGTLALNLADLETIDNSVINNGTIQWIASGTNTQGATSIFSGLGDMLITGTGTTELLGANTFTGGTTVDTTGFVNVGNSSAFGPGTLTINNGTIDTVNSQPLQINVGDYVQTGGELRIRLSGPGGAVNTQYSVTGTADINGGTVFLYDGIDIYDLDGYTPSEGDIQMIVDSTLGLTGTGFADNTPDSLIQGTNYSQGSTLLYPTITYDYFNDDVFITWVQDAFASVLDLTPNQTAVANSIDAGDAPAAVTDYLITQDMALLPGMYDLIAPDELTAIYQMGFAAAEIQNANIKRHLERVRQGSVGQKQYTSTSSDSKGGMVEQQTVMMNDTKRWTAFFEGTDGSATVDGDYNSSGYDFDTRGGNVGSDYRVSDRLSVGVMGSYADSNASLVNGGSIEAESFKGAVYATYYEESFYVDALLGAGYHSYDTSRVGLLGIAEGSTNAWEIDAMLNTGYDIKNGNWTYGPMASVAYTRMMMDSFTETGSLAPLHFPEQHQDSLRTELGAKIAYNADVNGMRITPQVRLAWQHEFMDSKQAMESSFVGGTGSTFIVHGPDMDRDRAVLSAGLTVQVTPTLSIYGFYDGHVGSSDYKSNQVTAGVKIDF